MIACTVMIHIFINVISFKHRHHSVRWVTIAALPLQMGKLNTEMIQNLLSITY